MQESHREQADDRSAHDHWTALLGAVSAACLAVLVITGVALLVHYQPSADRVVYDGAYAPLRGVEMSRAYRSVLHVSLDVKGGLLIRQAHHWAALILPASLTLQMLAAFFTGGFRRPRRSAWVLLCLVFLLTLGGGWSGYGLPDDSLAGTGLRIVEGITIGIPYIGRWLTAALFGGSFPGAVITRLYWIHVAVVPAALAVVLLLRAVVARRGPAAHVHGTGRAEGHVVRLPLRADLYRLAGMFLVATGLLVGIGGTVAVAPVWLYGPSSATSASAGSQPDWYTSFLDGALRLVPPGWELTAGGTWPLAVLLPQALVAAFLSLIVLVPFIEEWTTKDRRHHHLLDRPRDAPTRTALGVAGIAFYGTLWAAGATDIVATQLHVAFELQVYVLRAALIVGPVVAFLATRWICWGLLDRERDVRAHGRESGIIVRSASGGYSERHATPPTLSSATPGPPPPARPDEPADDAAAPVSTTPRDDLQDQERHAS